MDEILQLATLGRHIQIGMLYDGRSDTLIPDVTLWNSQTILKNTLSQNQPSTETEIITLDSMEKKANALNVSESLTASLLGGLVELKGSSKYLNDTKQSKQQARVTLQYKATNRLEQLMMTHLERQDIIYPSVFEEGTATHVITSVLYGAQAFFVFDRKVSSAENVQEIQLNLEMMIKHFQRTHGDSSLRMTEEQKFNANKLSCTFYGDFPLQNNPTTFQDFINIYTTLPILLGKAAEQSVPMTVWLYPLNKLDPKAAQLVRTISIGLVSHCQRVFDQLNEAVIRCNDMLNQSDTCHFPEIRDKILQYQNMCLEYKQIFQGKLARVLPSIRGGGDQEGVLTDILKDRELSPFRHESLIVWLDGMEREMMIVKLHLRILKDIPVVKSLSELHKELMNPAIDHVVCFAFTTLNKDDIYLIKATNYLKSHADRKVKRATTFDEALATCQHEHWFNSHAVCRRLKEQAKLFHDFATANRADKKTKFLVASVHDESILGANIYLYEGSNMKGRYFQPPSQPGRPMASGVTHDSVTLQLHPPKNGAEEIVNYKVEYQTLQQEGWTTLDTTDKSHSVTISGLQPHQEYNFRYSSVTKVGLSKVSDTYRTSTRPTGPPGNLDFQDCSHIFDYSRQTPSEVKIAQSSIKHFEERNVTFNKDGRLWKEIKPVDSQSHDNSQRMKRKTVSADSGGTARDNILIEIENEPNRKVHKACKEALLVVRGNPSIYKLNLQKIVFDQSRQFVKCSFGNPSSKHRMKTIVLLGATGAGKTTLINGMINYILGVKWEDDFRYKLIHEETGKSQAESQTSSITAYQIHHQVGFKIDYSLTVIDTPGFGDTRGISRDQLITENIREFFNSPKGVHQIDAVCFVVQATLARLTDTQRYMFDSILSIFGKDITDNIQILVTFADGQFPPILEALKLADVPCPTDKNDLPVYFKFNNSAIFAQHPISGNSANQKSADEISDDEENYASFNEIFWKMGTNNMKDFFTALRAMKYKSLPQAGKCLKEGKQLEAPVEGLYIQIREGLSNLEEIRKTQQMLNLHQTELNANGDFEYTISFTVAVKKDVRLFTSFANNCQKCHFTCHYPCIIPFNMFIYLCRTMDWWGNCKVCPQKCSFRDHSIESYRYDYESRTEKRTYYELKEKYEKIHGENITQENVMEILEQKFVKVRGTVLGLIEQFIQNIGNPNRLSTLAYIDRLIHSEEVEAMPGFEERIQTLRIVKKQAELREGSHKFKKASRLNA